MGNVDMGAISGLCRDFVLGATKVPLKKSSTWTIESPGQGRIAKPLRVRTSYGTMYLDLAPQGGFLGSPVVLVRLVVTLREGPQQVILDEPVLPGYPTQIVGFVTGDRFDLPGTDLSVEIGEMTDTTAEVSFSLR